MGYRELKFVHWEQLHGHAMLPRRLSHLAGSYSQGPGLPWRRWNLEQSNTRDQYIDKRSLKCAGLTVRTAQQAGWGRPPPGSQPAPSEV